MAAIIRVSNVSMMFNLSVEKIDSIKEYLINLVHGKLGYRRFYALQNVTFEIERGEAWGILGLNGSGKSTLLKIIAGVMKATEGSVEVHGSVAPLIELGAGFDMDLSARENIFLNGAVLGYSREEMRARYSEIMDFSELWEFEDTQVKNFSSGMLARLGFAISTMVKPDILIVDEILGVGDFKFQEKCKRRMADIMEGGTTLIFVSHSIAQVREVCSKAIWLERGHVVKIGSCGEVCDAYESQ